MLGWGIPDYQKASSAISIYYQSNVKKLLIYPNPVLNKITIGFPDSIQAKYNVEIVNVQGKIVYSEQRNEGSVRSTQISDIGYLPTGIYLIMVSDHSLMFSGKIIKK